MPIIQPDTSQAEDMSPIEPGTYRAKVVSCESKNSKEKGTPMIVPKFEVTVNGSDKPRKRQAYLVITGPGAGGFDQLLRATGFGKLADQLKDPAVQPKPPFDTDQLVGQECQVVVEEELYNNEKRDRIKSFLPL